MFKMIRKWFFKNEIVSIQLVQDETDRINNQTTQRLNKREEKLKEKEDNLSSRQNSFRIAQGKKLEEILKKSIDQNKKTLENIVDFDLLPWNKIWTLNNIWGDVIKEVEIESISIDKEFITINHSWRYSIDFFKTKNEAKKVYNNNLENCKIK